jgi:hypothetical protein
MAVLEIQPPGSVSVFTLNFENVAVVGVYPRVNYNLSVNI